MATGPEGRDHQDIDPLFDPRARRFSGARYRRRSWCEDADTDVGLERSGTWGTVPPHGWRHDGRGPRGWWRVPREARPAPPQPRGPAPRRGCRRPLPADGDRRHRRADRPRALRAGERLRSRRLRARLAPPAPGGRFGEHRHARGRGPARHRARDRPRPGARRRAPRRLGAPRGMARLAGLAVLLERRRPRAHLAQCRRRRAGAHPPGRPTADPARRGLATLPEGPCPARRRRHRARWPVACSA